MICCEKYVAISYITKIKYANSAFIDTIVIPVFDLCHEIVCLVYNTNCIYTNIFEDAIQMMSLYLKFSSSDTPKSWPSVNCY